MFCISLTIHFITNNGNGVYIDRHGTTPPQGSTAPSREDLQHLIDAVKSYLSEASLEGEVKMGLLMRELETRSSIKIEYENFMHALRHLSDENEILFNEQRKTIRPIV